MFSFTTSTTLYQNLCVSYSVWPVCILRIGFDGGWEEIDLSFINSRG